MAVSVTTCPLYAEFVLAVKVPDPEVAHVKVFLGRSVVLNTTPIVADLFASVLVLTATFDFDPSVQLMYDFFVVHLFQPMLDMFPQRTRPPVDVHLNSTNFSPAGTEKAGMVFVTVP
ncbi:MAG: hypothetical protein J6Y20_10215 [Lachnospiraceae bacterium]|nr:hypothetical protein [Lachnospiraceae bacterium]MBP5462488.1 hypothetical protein [Lachnospiraceae bacterium]